MSENVILNLDTPSVQYLCQKDMRLGKIINMLEPISYIPHNDDAYSFLVHEIIEQMLSVKSGQKIYGRLLDLCNSEITPKRVSTLSLGQLHSVGTSNAKAEYILNMTNAIISGDLKLDELEILPDTEVIKALTKINGIGKWTAKMYLIFVLDRPDVLPYEDGAFLQVYRWLYKTNDCREKSVIKKCKKWSPYSSIASRFFYKALNAGMTKQEFHLYKS